MWEILNIIKDLAISRNYKAYLVGGTVRDKILGIRPHDLDIAVSEGAISLAQLLARKLQGTVIVMDKERETVRVVLKLNNQVDFGLLRGSSIEDDLLLRDFTINAMAIDLHNLSLNDASDWGNLIIDPTDGLQDLKLGLLKAVSNNATLDDPLRVLRGIRLAARYNLSVVPHTGVLMKRGARRIEQSAGERIWQELATLLFLPGSFAWIDFMDRELELWHYLLPGRRRMEETRQNYYHVENVWCHSLRTFACLELIIKELPINITDGQFVIDYLHKEIAGGRNRLQLLKLAALIHDVGKPDTAITHENGTISFHGHPEAGLPYTEALSKKLKLSRDETSYLLELVRLHMKPLHLFTSREHSTLSIYKLFKDLEPNVLDVLILSLADLTATYTSGERLSELAAYRNFSIGLITNYNLRRSDLNPCKLLSGKELIELGVPEGPLVGKFLDQLAEAQVVGEVWDIASAKDWVNDQLKNLETN